MQIDFDGNMTSQGTDQDVAAHEVAHLERLYWGEQALESQRSYDHEAQADRADESQDAYHKRIKAIHERELERTGLAGFDAYNRVSGDSDLSPEILEVLAINPNQASYSERQGFEVTGFDDAYDEAVMLSEIDAVGSYLVQGEACWSKPLPDASEVYSRLDLDRFDSKKFDAKQRKLAKRRAAHGIEDIALNKAGQYRKFGARVKDAMAAYKQECSCWIDEANAPADYLDNLGF